MVSVYVRNIFGALLYVVWRRQEQYELVLVFIIYVLLLYDNNIYWYV